MKNKRPQLKNRRRSKKPLVFTSTLIIVIILLMIVSIVLYIHHHDNKVNLKGAAVNTNSSAPNAKSVIGGTGTTSTSTPSQSSTQASSTGSSTASTSTSSSNAAAPEAPSGQFVSNHSPGANGSPEVETSICNVNPGTSCSIKFTQGSTTKSLNPSSQTAGSSASVAWSNWTPSGIGLTSGNWTITATATANGASSTTTDPDQLTVE